MQCCVVLCSVMLFGGFHFAAAFHVMLCLLCGCICCRSESRIALIHCLESAIASRRQANKSSGTSVDGRGAPESYLLCGKLLIPLTLHVRLYTLAITLAASWPGRLLTLCEATKPHDQLPLCLLIRCPEFRVGMVRLCAMIMHLAWHATS